MKYLSRSFSFDGKLVRVCEHIMETVYTMADNNVYISSGDGNTGFEMGFNCYKCSDCRGINYKKLMLAVYNSVNHEVENAKYV